MDIVDPGSRLCRTSGMNEVGTGRSRLGRAGRHKKGKKKGSIDSEIEFSDYPYHDNIPSIKISMDRMEQEPMLGDKFLHRDKSETLLNAHSPC